MSHWALDYTERSVLCLVLSRAILDLLRTGWMQTLDDFGLHHVSVFRFENPDKLILREPFLTYRVPKKDPVAPSHRPVIFELHSEPQMLGLGIAMMQILLGKQVDSHLSLDPEAL